MESLFDIARLVAFVVAVVAVAARQLRPHAVALRAGVAGVREHWRTWLAIGHLGAVPVLVCYLLVVGGNSLAFDYSFWYEPAPTTTADTVAVVSLWSLYLVASLVGAATYGWMCELSLSGESRLTLTGGRAALRRGLRGAPVAVPAFAATLAGLPFVLPTIVLVALFGAAPFRSLVAPGTTPGAYVRFVRRRSEQLIAIALVFSLVAVPIDAATAAGFYITANHDGLIESSTWLIAWAGFALAVLWAGGAASAFAFVWSDREP